MEILFVFLPSLLDKGRQMLKKDDLIGEKSEKNQFVWCRVVFSLVSRKRPLDIRDPKKNILTLFSDEERAKVEEAAHETLQQKIER